jgi:hypothetical protein
MLSKSFIVALIVSISFNLLFGYLSYTFYADKASAESKLQLCQSTNKALEISLEKEKKVCEIQDDVVSSYNESKDSIQKEEKDTLSFIDSMPRQNTQKQSVEKVDNAKEGSIDLDAKLPPALADSLHQVYRRVQGQGTSDAQ